MNNPRGCYLDSRVLLLLQNVRESKKGSIIVVDFVWEKVKWERKVKANFFINVRCLDSKHTSGNPIFCFSSAINSAVWGTWCFFPDAVLVQTLISQIACLALAMY